MLQDIAPYSLNLHFERHVPQPDDYILIFRKDAVLLLDDGQALPRFQDLGAVYPETLDQPYFLFSISGSNFFLGPRDLPARDRFTYHNLQVFRTFSPSWLGYAGATASHLATWLEKNRFCGGCGAPTVPSSRERALLCERCGNTVYPTIAPVIIVGVRDGERLLLTRYANASHRRYALVAGFIEIGETFEDAVRREVLEEVGVRVTNIRYYKSQPWAFSQSVLAGFFADLDGPDAITLDDKELAEAVWLRRSEIPEDDNTMSLTATMIQSFRKGEIV